MEIVNGWMQSWTVNPVTITESWYIPIPYVRYPWRSYG